MLSEVKHPLLTKETVAAIKPFANADLADVWPSHVHRSDYCSSITGDTIFFFPCFSLAERTFVLETTRKSSLLGSVQS